MKPELLPRFKEIEELAKKMGLDFFPVIFEEVNRDIMLEACSYGLPKRFRHFSHGSSYDRQKIYGERGWGRVYEIIFNNNPSYAYMMSNNTDTINLMVAAHCYGHANFFKNNVMFKDTDRNMIARAAERANKVDRYIEKFGIDKVEHLIDIGFALDRHIDFNKGIYRKKYPSKCSVDVVSSAGEFEDLFSIGDTSRRSVHTKVVGEKIPPKPEKDLLWFFINYGPLEDWEKEILGYMREESHYFWPIVATKTINEGFACVLGDTPIYTESGLITMSDVVNSEIPVIYDGENTKQITNRGVFHDRDTIKITTKKGLSLCGADNHRIMDLSGNWCQMNELCVGDKVRISKLGGAWPKEKQKINFTLKIATSRGDLCKQHGISFNTLSRHLNKTHATKEKNINIIQKILEIDNAQNNLPQPGVRKIVKFPEIMDENFGSFLGYLIGDGHISLAARNFGLTTGDEEQADNFACLANTLFGVGVSKKWDNSSKNGRWRVNVHAQDLSRFFINHLGMHYGVCARKKEIPQIILRSPKSVMSAFLRSYYDCDGCASEKCGIILSTSSDKLAEQTQIVLLNYGILSHRHKAKDECWQVRIYGQSAKIFYEEIGFGLQRKQEKLGKYINNRKWFCKEKWEDTIVKTESCGKQDVYDISVADTHKYVASGFINHNSFSHAEIMCNYDGLSESEHLEFAKIHSSVINPGSTFNLNPYYIGFKVFTDIRERWDKLFKDGKSDINGIQKVLQVAAEEDDSSFLRNYLTKELASEMGLFNYGYKLKRDPDMSDEDLTDEHGIVELKDRELSKIIDNIVGPTVNYGAPLITVCEMDGDRLVLKHEDKFGPLDKRYTEKTLEYIWELWGGNIELVTYDHDESEIIYSYDENGFDTL